MTTPEPSGECLFCQEHFAKKGINRHLQKHLKEKSLSRKSGRSFLLKIGSNPSYWSKASYFLSLWIDGNTSMGDLDSFLRHIWLDCCGHMSSFTVALPIMKN